ncbi:MAG TPA: copper chaperone PCu(A)C, partial [Vicinamibacterales bacterium]|nr:copper chaperone PCu(A)C [Vicinamibacterales bacterium]
MAAILVLGGLELVSAVQAQTPTLTAHDAWAREPMGGRNMTGLFVVVENAGSAPRAIVSAATDAADKVELHEMKNDGGMMRMSPVKQIDVPAHGKAELKPGSFHVMLFGLKDKLVAGDSINLTLTFDDGTTVTTAASVRKPGG